MKIEVTESESELMFPCLLQNISIPKIVVIALKRSEGCSNHFDGIIIRSDVTHYIGDYVWDYVISLFTPFTGKVTLDSNNFNKYDVLLIGE